MIPIEEKQKEDILRAIKDILNDEDKYNYWFSSIDLLKKGQSIIIPLQNSFFITYYEQNFKEVISSAVEKALEAPYSISFIKDASANSSPPPLEKEKTSSPLSDPPKEPVAPPQIDFNLNPAYTFENYIVGPCNRLAQAVAFAVTESLGKTYNPLFIHGSFGVGKSHLIQAICHETIKKYQGLSIQFQACEEFVNNYVSALRQGQLDVFRRKYRSLDILLIDDIHFLADKEGIQEEFFHTFNSLFNAEKQIILSSDAPAQEIPAIQERLISRFLWGMEVKISAPGYETRVAILQQKAETLGLQLDTDILDFLAKNLTKNIRELEGAVNNIHARVFLTKTPLTLENVKLAIQNLLDTSVTTIKITDIQEAVVKYFNLKISDLLSKKRTKSITIPRQIAVYLAKKLTSHSLEEIGSFFGGRDHSTIIHSIEKISKRIEQDQQFAASLSLLEKNITKRRI